MELGGIRLIEAILPDGTIVYRETNFGQETEVPIFIGNLILFTFTHSKFSFMFRDLLQNSWWIFLEKKLLNDGNWMLWLTIYFDNFDKNPIFFNRTW